MVSANPEFAKCTIVEHVTEHSLALLENLRAVSNEEQPGAW